MALLVGLAGFGRLIARQQLTDAERERQLRLAAVNAAELESLAYRFDAFDGGGRYVDASHPYTGDLDVFGPRSVFALVNRTVSLVGHKALGDYMRHVLTEVDHVHARQDAISELAGDIDWRQDFAVAAVGGEQTPTQLDALRGWARAEPQFQEGYWRVLLIVVPLLNLGWLVSFAYLPFMLALLGYAPTVWLLYRQKAKVDAIEKATTESLAQLQQSAAMLALIGAKTWRSDLLQGLRRLTVGTGVDAASAIEALAYDVRQLAVRANPFVVLLNVFGLWEIRYARRLEVRKAELAGGEEASSALPAAADYRLPTAGLVSAAVQHPIERWLAVLGAFDAMSSMAGVGYRYAFWRKPHVATAGDHAGGEVYGRSLHHPLLPPGKSVPNDFASPLANHISLLTGSNMAGKSTLLRTVGLHLCMAQWGMATPNEELRLSPTRVYTSMRTQDNLHEGASAFYAELTRLRIVVDATRDGEGVFFLLDEILKGTNSHDRNAGGRALIRQLLHYGGAGVVATHDLELGQLAEETTAVSTLRLEVEMNAAGELYFDYTVKPGLAESRNASALMRQLGLGVIEGE